MHHALRSRTFSVVLSVSLALAVSHPATARASGKFCDVAVTIERADLSPSEVEDRCEESARFLGLDYLTRASRCNLCEKGSIRTVEPPAPPGGSGSGSASSAFSCDDLSGDWSSRRNRQGRSVSNWTFTRLSSNRYSGTEDSRYNVTGDISLAGRTLRVDFASDCHHGTSVVEMNADCSCTVSGTMTRYPGGKDPGCDLNDGSPSWQVAWSRDGASCDSWWE